MTEKPLISGRFTEIWGMRPDAKPTTSSRPSKAMQRVDSSKTSPPTGSRIRSAPRPPVRSFTVRSEARRVGKEVSVRVDLGGRRIIKQKKNKQNKQYSNIQEHIQQH